MALQKSDLKHADAVFYFIENETAFQNMDMDELKAALPERIEKKFPKDARAQECVALFLAMMRGANTTQRLSIPEKIKERCWKTVETIRNARRNVIKMRLREKAKRTIIKRTREMVVAETRANTETKWKKMFELATGDVEENWATVSAHENLTRDVQFALHRKLGKPRENFFRKMFQLHPEKKAIAQAMVNTVVAHTMDIAALQRERAPPAIQGRERISRERRGPETHHPEKNSPGGNTPQYKSPTLVHGPHWAGLLPKGNGKNKRKKQGGGNTLPIRPPRKQPRIIRGTQTRRPGQRRLFY